jgi:HSP20 family molecular chaperone IbpA
MTTLMLSTFMPVVTAQYMYTAWPPLAARYANIYEPDYSPFDRISDLSEYARKKSTENWWPRTASTDTWVASNDAYTYKTRLPDLEPDSVTAEMSADSSSIKVNGKRAFDGCSCEARQVYDIELPYRPRADDVSVSIDSGLLTLKLARHAKVSEAVPLKVTVAETTVAEKTTTDAPSPSGTRPLRFVPHESATTSTNKDDSEGKVGSVSTIEAQEKGLMDKFRAAGKVAVAMASGSTTAASEDPSQVNTQPPATEATEPKVSGNVE